MYVCDCFQNQGRRRSRCVDGVSKACAHRAPDHESAGQGRWWGGRGAVCGHCPPARPPTSSEQVNLICKSDVCQYDALHVDLGFCGHCAHARPTTSSEQVNPICDTISCMLVRAALHDPRPLIRAGNLIMIGNMISRMYEHAGQSIFHCEQPCSFAHTPPEQRLGCWGTNVCPCKQLHQADPAFCTCKFKVGRSVDGFCEYL